MHATAAHKDTLKYLKGYPIVIEKKDLLFSLDTGSIGIDGQGNRIYPIDEIFNVLFGFGPFNQGAVIIERSTRNLIFDSQMHEAVNWNANPAGNISSTKPYFASGSDENSFEIISAINQTLTLETATFIDPSFINAGDNIIQSCWIKTDANAIRFVYDSSTTGVHYDDYVTLSSEKWQHIEGVNPYTIQSDDLSGHFKSFKIETSSNATYLYVFRPQTEVGENSTSWTDGQREEGVLSYTKSYFNINTFTLAVWFNIKHMPSTYSTILSICSDDTAYKRLIIYYGNDNKIYIKGSNSNIELFNIASDDLDLNKWHHMAITFDSFKYKFYINGQNIDTKQESRQLEFDINSKLFLGSHNYHNTLNGYLSDVLITPRVLDDLTVRYIYEASQPLFNPLAYVGQL